MLQVRLELTTPAYLYVLEPQTLVIFCHEDYSNSYLMSRRMLEYNRLDEYTKI